MLLIFGCLDSEACNYDSDANVDDGSCEYYVDENFDCEGNFCAAEGFVIINEGFDELCYYQSDLDILQDIIDLNESLNGGTWQEPLEIGYQEWKNGRLTYLNLNYNQLTSLPESIGNLSNLEYLDLFYNQITSLPESIGDLSSLLYLMLSSNKLTSLK